MKKTFQYKIKANLQTYQKAEKWLCKICNNVYSKQKSLVNHLWKGHRLNIKDYYDSFLKSANEGICLNCGKETKYRGYGSGYNMYCCKDCSNQHTGIKKRGKPFQLNQEQRKNRVAWRVNKPLSNKWKSIISEAQKLKYKNGWQPRIGKTHSQLARENIKKSLQLLPVYKKNEQNQKISEKVSLAYIEGRFNHQFKDAQKGYFYSVKNKKDIYYRSSYEFRALKILEQISTILRYEVEPIKIPYKNKNGEIRNTIPDIKIIYMDGSEEILEIKPDKKLKKDSQTQIKISATKAYAKENGYKFSIWTEKELQI